ncbi:MAG TPA: hypothetical protein VK960_07470 [Acidimicrobiia bacterium]|nr:hypothetical protein [Acidimicrobiia bacterium]
MFTRRILATLVFGLAVSPVVAAPADAIVILPHEITIEGDPTLEETTAILEDWAWITGAFPGTADCVEPVTVVVVDANAWGGGIAAYYRPSQDTVYIKHGKVRSEHLIHEFAHHLDFSCGFGSSERGSAFRTAQGFESDHEWARGSSWREVPAEHFAEAVVGYLGIDSVDLPVSDGAYRQVHHFAMGWSEVRSSGPVGPTVVI